MNSFLRYTGKLVMIGLFTLMMATPSSFAKNLRMLSAYPKNMAFVDGCLDAFNSNLARLSDGKMSTSYSGPDVIPTVEQFQPLQTGVFDMLFTIGPYHLGTIAIGSMVDTMDHDPAKRRSSGVFKFIDEQYNKLGVKVVAIMPVTDLHFLTRVPLEGKKPSLSGLKVRTAPTVVSMVKAFGGSPVNLAPGEVYTSLQKGIIDGTVMISYGGWNYKWHEVTKYIVRPTFGGMSTYLLMNLKKYNRLSPKERQIIVEAGRMAELEATDFFKNKKAEEFAKLKAHGLKVTHMQPEDAKKANDLYNSTLWYIGIMKSGEPAKQLKALAIKQGLSR